MVSTRRAVACASLLWAADGTVIAASPRVPALQGDTVITTPPTPGGATLGGSFGTPTINSLGRVAFSSSLNGGSGGAGVLTDVGAVHVVARNGDTAPGTGGSTFGGISGQPLIADNGAIAFTSLVGATQNLGVWWGDVGGSGPLAVQALHAATAPCSPPGTYFMSTSVPFAMSRNGKMAFTCRFDATGTGLSYAALFTGTGGGLTMHARQDAPPSSVGFSGFGQSQINNDGVACLFVNFISPPPPPPAGTGGARTGIFTGASGGLNGTATSLSPTVDGAGAPTFAHYTGFDANGYDVNGSNAVVFSANLDTPATPSGLFIFDSQGVREIGRLNAVATAAGIPAGATFGFIDPPIICDNGDVYFMANLTNGPGGVTSANNAVLFRYRGHTLSVIAREGDQIPGLPAGQFFSFSLTPIGANEFGQVAFNGTISIPGGSPSSLEAVFATDRLGVPRVLYKGGDVLTVHGGLVRTFSSFSTVLRSGGNDGRPQSINSRGEVALVASCNIAPGQPFGQNGRGVIVLDAPAGPCGVADVGSQGGLFGADGRLDNNDFIAFINLFFIFNPAADVGRQGGLAGADGQFNNNDFIDFIAEFFAGCV